MFNPYPNLYGFYQAPNQHILPQQQILQVNGKASVDTIQLAPNSSLLAMDNTAPIVWMCVSDGVGKVTATPYDVIPHKDEPTISIDQRLTNIEKTIAEMEKQYEKSYDSKPKPKQNDANGSCHKGYEKPRSND